jgi:hypothetical protein
MVRALAMATLVVAGSSTAASDDVPCASAASRWSPPIPITRSELAESRGAGLGLGAFDVVIQPGAGLAGNAAALAAWDRAAASWEAIIADPITVTIAADLVDIGEPGVLGQTDPVLFLGDVDEIRDAMAAAAGAEPDDGIVDALPTAAQLRLLLAPGSAFNGEMVATKANLKALGFTGLDAQAGARDASIVFNAGFAFDFDHSDGTTPGTVDFESVAAHELGHALGFISGVDFLDGGSVVATPMPLDLFRFPDGTVDDPGNRAEFTSARRSQRPGSNDVFDDVAVEHRMSTGADRGDGRQASHWKDDALTGVYVGLMDASLSPRTILTLTDADARAIDVIGWDVATSGATTSSVTVTTSTTTTTLPPECFVDETCLDADPCTRDVCTTVCLHLPVSTPADVASLVPVVGTLEGCLARDVPRALEKRVRQVRRLLERAERARKPARARALLARAGARIGRVVGRADQLSDAGRLDALCAATLADRMDDVRGALGCLAP